MHLYIAQSVVQRYTDENFARAATPEIDPIFAVQDPIRHLVCWHSNVSHNSRRRVVSPAAPHPLVPRHLNRVLAYIGANIGRDIALCDLTQLVGVSKRHFIRTFRAATQRTPYCLFGRVAASPARSTR
jgi:AraC family transcriptional regulator